MKPISPLYLLFFLRITTAAPIPSKHTKVLLEYNIHFQLYQYGFDALLDRAYKRNSPSSKVPNPQFPCHLFLPYSSSSSASVADYRLSEQVFNNAPISPPTAVRPRKALNDNLPLESSCLPPLRVQAPPQLDPEPESKTDVLPAKPTTALPQLRGEQLEQYRASLEGEKNELVQETVLVVWDDRSAVPSPKHFYQSNHDMPTGTPDSRAIRGQSMSIANTYSDLLVVRIVILFLCAIVVWEGVEIITDIRSTVRRSRRQSQGEIFLEDDKTAPSKKPFISSLPPPRHEIAVNICTDLDADTEKQTLHCESDVFSKV